MKARQRSTISVMLVLAVWGTLASVSALVATGDGKHRVRQEVSTGPSEVEAPFESVEYVWTSWNPSQYVLVDDGESLWNGTSMGLLRWDKATSTYHRYTQFEGFPQTNVFAGAVDQAGNRWFGGDAGLSRLDANEHWTHYTMANSGLTSNYVDGVAITADGSIWVSHSLPDSEVDRLELDGAWSWYPNRQAATTTHFAEILTTKNQNPLWTVTTTEVWVGYSVFDGIRWVNRTPPSVSPTPRSLMVDGAGVIWAAASQPSYPAWLLLAWRNVGWTRESPTISWDNVVWSVEEATLAVDPAGKVWLGFEAGRCWGFPHGSCDHIVGFGRLTNAILDKVRILDRRRWHPPLVLPTADGVFAAGDDWLISEGSSLQWRDVPSASAYETNLLIDANGFVWLASNYELAESYSAQACWSELQIIDDHGTGRLDDDVWQRSEPLPPGGIGILELAPNGDVWANLLAENTDCGWPLGLFRWRNGAWTRYTVFSLNIEDVFVQDSANIWLTYWDNTKGIVHIDDHGTPDDQSDDIYTNYPTAGLGEHDEAGFVTVDGLGRLWHGSTEGLFRYDRDEWVPVFRAQGITDLASAPDGTVFAQLGSAGGFLSILPTGGQEQWPSVESLVAGMFEAVRSAYRGHRMWQIGSDGSVWYLEPRYLRRRDATRLYSFFLPTSDVIRDYIVDDRNRVWISARPNASRYERVNTILWRLSLLPDFSLDNVVSQWLIEPESVSQHRVPIGIREGFAHPVTLSTSGLPSGVNMDFTPNPVQAGQEVTLTVSAAHTATLDVTSATLLGVSAVISHTLPLTVSVVEQVRVRYLPLMVRR